MKSRLMALCFVVALAGLVVGSPGIFAAALPGGDRGGSPGGPGGGGDEAICVWASIQVAPSLPECYTTSYGFSARFASTCADALAHLEAQAGSDVLCSSACHVTDLGCWEIP